MKVGVLMETKRVYAQINLNNLIFNINNIKSKTGTPVMAVIKADAYGHGAVECAKALEENGVTDFAVATAQEAIELRQNNIRSEILILGYVFPENFEELISNDISLTVFDYETACELNKAAKRIQKKAKIHIKLDTGMGRIGFIPNEKSLEEIKIISLLENIIIDGVFSHFACADMTDKSYTYSQKKTFNDFVKKIEDNNISIKTKHICNSAGIMDFDDGFLDIVRSGIISYGLYPSDEVKTENLEIRPVMSLISHVVHIKEVEKDFCVSYGSTYKTSGKTTIATIPVGYGDGYPRSLSNCGKVLINGEFAPIIGRVCMDQFMVDITNIPDIQRGTEVTLVGTNGDKKITVEDLSALCNRFNYEFVCDINKRVPRIYIR